MRRRVRVGWVRVRVCAAPGRGGAATSEARALCATLAEGSPQERMHAATGFAEEVLKACLEDAVMRTAVEAESAETWPHLNIRKAIERDVTWSRQYLAHISR